MLHTVVVVVGGTVVGGTYCVGVVAGGVVAVPDDPEELWGLVVVVVGGTAVALPPSSDVLPPSSDVLTEAAGTVVVGTVLTGLALPARYVTSSADTSPEPRRRAWVIRRARAKRRSRCWGVRVEGVIRFP